MILIMSCYVHGFPWLSQQSSLSSIASAGIQDYILCVYRAVVNKFYLVVQHLHVSVKGYIEECRLWFRPYFSSSFPRQLLVLYGYFRDKS